MSDETELTPEEKMEFDKLPREAAPSDFVWQRIVRDLREDGTLRRAEAGGRRFRPWLVAAASMAASLVLFGSGALMGHWMGTRSTERAFLAAREQDATLLAQRVQEAGSAYVAALAALGDLRPVAGRAPALGAPVAPALAATEIRQGREAALAALYGAAVELARLAPGDPDVSEVIRILESRRFQGTGGAGTRQQIWY
jgi:hypothetical protein